MGFDKGESLHLWAVRMDWLRWLARPLVAVWRFLVWLATWAWNLVRMAWRALVASCDRRYWFLAAIGGAVAVFFLASFFFLGNRLHLPWLPLVGVVLGLLPIAWAVAEIGALLRRQAATGEEYRLGEIRYQLGAGFKAVAALLKYVVLFLVAAAVAGGLALTAAVPDAGPALFALAAVPLTFFGLLALGCLVLLLFGVAVVPVHVLYGHPYGSRSFLRRQAAELGALLAVVRRKWPAYLFANVPYGVFGALLTVLPALVLGAALAIPCAVAAGVGQAAGLTDTLLAGLGRLGATLLSGSWDALGAVSAIVGALSLAVLVGLLLAPLLAFFAAYAYRLYTFGLVPESDADLAAGLKRAGLPGTAGAAGAAGATGAAGAAAGYSGATGYGNSGGTPSERGGASWGGAAALGAGALGVGALGAVALAGNRGPAGDDDDRLSLEDLDRDRTTAADGLGTDDESLRLSDLDDDDISSEDILASIESTMPIADQPVLEEGLTPDDETFTLDDLDAGRPAGGDFDDDVSGADILASIEATMPIAERPADGDDDISNEDILSSIESTMPIADEPVFEEGLVPDDDAPLAAYAPAGDDEDETIKLDDLEEFRADDLLGVTPAPLDANTTTREVDDLLATFEGDSHGATIDDLDGAQLDEALLGDVGGDIAGPLPEKDILLPDQFDAENDSLSQLDVDGMFAERAPDAGPPPAAYAAEDNLDGIAVDQDLLDSLVVDAGPGTPGGFDDADDLLAPAVPAARKTPAADDGPALDLDDDLLGPAPASAKDPLALDDLSFADAGGDEPLALDGLDGLDGLDDNPVSLDDLTVDGADDPEAETDEDPGPPIPINIKGNAGSWAYLASVKDDNQLYFGVKGSPDKLPANFLVMLNFTRGGLTSETISLPELDAKGMAYTKVDLSSFLSKKGYGRVESIDVTPA